MGGGNDELRRVRQITPLGLKIKTELIRQDITAKELASKIGMSQMTISNIISGKNQRRETIDLVLKTLGIEDVVEL